MRARKTWMNKGLGRQRRRPRRQPRGPRRSSLLPYDGRVLGIIGHRVSSYQAADDRARGLARARRNR